MNKMSRHLTRFFLVKKSRQMALLIKLRELGTIDLVLGVRITQNKRCLKNLIKIPF